MRYSLGFVLAISLAGLQFLAILFVVTTSYLSSERAILDHARGLMQGAGANAVEHTKRFLDPRCRNGGTGAPGIELGARGHHGPRHDGALFL